MGSDPMRLVEAADLALAPSAAFLDSLSRLDAGPAPLGLVVADPTGDLPIARRVGVALAERTGATALVGRDATRAALASGLARAGATSSVAIFGHAALPAGGAAHLLLADGALDADEIGMLDRWPPPDQAPRRVLLAACASAGLADLGVGSEWLGLAPAILRAGTATVVATTWPLPEHPAVAELDVQLAELLTTSNDPVAALGDIQRAWLARWRADGWRTSAEQASGAVDPGHASPLLWAGLVVATNGTRG